MESLVLYDSRFGNTRKIAEVVAEVLDGQIMCVTDFEPGPLAEADVVIVGSPIHGWRPSEDTTKFLSQLEKDALRGKYVAAFDTGYSSILSGDAAAKIIKALVKAGGNPLIHTHKFIVEHSEGPLGSEEIDKARDWAQELKTQYGVIHKVPSAVSSQ